MSTRPLTQLGRSTGGRAKARESNITCTIACARAATNFQKGHPCDAGMSCYICSGEAIRTGQVWVISEKVAEATRQRQQRKSNCDRAFLVWRELESLAGRTISIFSTFNDPPQVRHFPSAPILLVVLGLVSVVLQHHDQVSPRLMTLVLDFDKGITRTEDVAFAKWYDSCQ